MAKTQRTAGQKVAAVCLRHEADGWRYYAHYSGRFMYGKCCPGIVCPHGEEARAAAALQRATGGRLTRDDMGLNVIVYAPSIAADPVGSDEEE